MNCRDIKYCLPDFVRGKSPEDEAPFITEHLTACESCSHEADELSAFVGDLSVRAVAVPADAYWLSVLPRLHERLEKRRSMKLLPGSIRLILPLSVAVMLVVILTSRHPLNKALEGQEIHTLVHELPAAELDQLAQRDEVNDAYEASDILSPGAEVQPADKDMLKILMLEEGQSDYYSVIDADINDGPVADEDADELITRLRDLQTMN